ncbi:hypothetical protein C8R45DRAFT_314875 [Mycena sanguinolenta]|nr:hypothetical protein C8R45DRAFT_314875 [Mycena sanguinolenta]
MGGADPTQRGGLFSPLAGHVFFDPARLSATVQSPANSQYVKNLCIFYPSNASAHHFDNILANCSSIQNLVLFGGHTGLLPFLSTMSLRRLYTIPHFFFPKGPEFSHPFFLHITRHHPSPVVGRSHCIEVMERARAHNDPQSHSFGVQYGQQPFNFPNRASHLFCAAGFSILR